MKSPDPMGPPEKGFTATPPKDYGYRKRIFTASSFLRELGFVTGHLPRILGVLSNKKNSHLIGKILLVTDAMNDCQYCTWLDAKLAMKEGANKEDILQIIQLAFHADAAEQELPALLFAQHVSESNGNPDPEMTARLVETYGEKTAADIQLAIRAVTFGNLYFNTWEAALSRFGGKPAPNSNPVFEAIFFLCNFMIILPFVILKKVDRGAL